MPQDIRQVSMSVGAGGTSQVVNFSTSTQSTALTCDHAIVTCTTDCFVRSGSNPTALSDGTDRFLVGGVPYRLAVIKGEKLAFIGVSSASGKAYITPETA